MLFSSYNSPNALVSALNAGQMYTQVLPMIHLNGTHASLYVGDLNVVITSGVPRGMHVCQAVALRTFLVRSGGDDTGVLYKDVPYSGANNVYFQVCLFRCDRRTAYRCRMSQTLTADGTYQIKVAATTPGATGDFFPLILYANFTAPLEELLAPCSATVCFDTVESGMYVRVVSTLALAGSAFAVMRVLARRVLRNQIRLGQAPQPMATSETVELVLPSGGTHTQTA